ncbi:hypothetical protein BDV98DRAFT_572874 [Pterulicium gracile]|uniref:Uncharacterized protein n=1 Tax=Pterulicium gracile TaxID=1884261 RepID=A0A5C3QJN1_9AGAR|nr:hypothetical protein BDV98DRAFT_572874 [Pterula gracilis]
MGGKKQTEAVVLWSNWAYRCLLGWAWLCELASNRTRRKSSPISSWASLVVAISILFQESQVMGACRAKRSWDWAASSW